MSHEPKKATKINESASHKSHLLRRAPSQQDVQPTQLCQRGGTSASNDVLARTHAVIGRCTSTAAEGDPSQNQCATSL